MIEEPAAGCSLDWPRPDCACVRFQGELDAFAAVRLREEVAALQLSEPPRLVVDLTAVAFIDSTGIRLLLELLGRHRGRDLVIVGPQAMGPRRALEIVGISRIVPFVNAVSEALETRAVPGSAEGGVSV